MANLVKEKYYGVVRECEYEYVMRIAYRSGHFSPADEQRGITQWRNLSPQGQAQAIGEHVLSWTKEDQ